MNPNVSGSILRAESLPECGMVGDAASQPCRYPSLKPPPRISISKGKGCESFCLDVDWSEMVGPSVDILISSKKSLP